MVGYRVPSALSPQSLATGIAAEILGDTPNGRLHQALVATGKAAQVFNFTIDAREPGFVLFGAVVKKGEPLEPVRQAMIDVIEGSWTKTPADRCRAKAPGAEAAHRVRPRTGRSAGIRRRTVRVHIARGLAPVLSAA